LIDYNEVFILNEYHNEYFYINKKAAHYNNNEPIRVAKKCCRNIFLRT